VINRVMLVGTLTSNAEMADVTGKPMTRLLIATHSEWKDADGIQHETVENHAIVCFGRAADVGGLYGATGRRVYIDGRLRTRECTGPDGVRAYTTEIVADTVRLIPGNAAAAGGAETPREAGS
jgi:single-strand DNA-binding protein